MTSKKNTKTTKKKFTGFTEAEREAMQERARELVAESRGSKEGEVDVLSKIAKMTGQDKVMAKRLHALVKKNAPSLSPKTWYGMPAYATVEGKVVCFFQNAARFKSRYATFGFSDVAKLDEGDVWPISFALKKLTPAAEKKIIALLKKAVR